LKSIWFRLKGIEFTHEDPQSFSSSKSGATLESICRETGEIGEENSDDEEEEFTKNRKAKEMTQIVSSSKLDDILRHENGVKV